MISPPNCALALDNDNPQGQFINNGPDFLHDRARQGIKP
jgi:hypothetical protein